MQRKMIKLINLADKAMKNIAIDENKDIKFSIEAMEKSGLKTVVIIDLKGKICGLISDGDIRRALYRGLSIDSSVKDVMSTNPIVSIGDVSKNEVVRIMEDSKISFIPSVDKNGFLLGVWSSDVFDKLPELSNSFVIMAGGKGSRLGELTSETPKPLLEIGGIPIIERIIRSARQSGFRNFIITVNYLAHKIKDYLGNGNQFGINIEYIDEDKPLGTAGSLSLISNRPTSEFIVVNGDIISDVCYRELLEYHLNCSSIATVAVRTHLIENPYGVLHISDNVLLSCEEKPKYRSNINAGMYVLNPKVLDLMQVDEYCDMPSLLMTLVENGSQVTTYRLRDPWIDIGRPNDLQSARKIENDK